MYIVGTDFVAINVIGRNGRLPNGHCILGDYCTVSLANIFSFRTCH